MGAEFEGVFQDSGKMSGIATDIVGDSKELEEEVADMYRQLEDELGDEDTGNRAWFGPKARVFLNNIIAKKNDFAGAVKNVDAVGTNLQEQADAWNQFESR